MQITIISLLMFCIGLVVGKYVRTLDLAAITLKNMRKEIEESISFVKIEGRDIVYIDDIYNIMDKYIGKTISKD